MTVRRPIRKEVVESLPPGSAAWDTEVRGFGVRRQRRDAFYIVKYRDKDGRQRIVTIGRHGPGEWMPDRARKEAIRIKGLVRDGRDPAAERDRSRDAPPFANSRPLRQRVCDAAQKAEYLAEDERLLRHILPALGDQKLVDIGRPKWRGSMRECGQLRLRRTGRWPCCLPSWDGPRGSAIGRTVPTRAVMLTVIRRRPANVS